MSCEAAGNTGKPLLRTLAMPHDTNPSGDIFGGWLMSQMDIAGAILAFELAMGRVVTIAVDAITFMKPVLVGDVVCCYGQLVHIGRTSMKIRLEVWTKKVSREPFGESCDERKELAFYHTLSSLLFCCCCCCLWDSFITVNETYWCF